MGKEISKNSVKIVRLTTVVQDEILAKVVAYQLFLDTDRIKFLINRIVGRELKTYLCILIFLYSLTMQL
jgi:hypothetical protein